MNILSSIMEKVLPGHDVQAQTQAQVSPRVQSQGKGQANVASSSQPMTSAAPIDVQSVLSQMAQKKSEKLNWQSSIVDLMKLLDMDSSFSARQQLAKELNFSGSISDSASMNMWLQKEVMKRFASNGGKVPPELLH